MSEERIDIFVKKALERHRAEMPDDAWFNFFSKHSSYFRENPIDNTVYQAMQQLPYVINVAPDWNTFREKYEADSLDDFMRDSLKPESRETPAGDWAAFSSKLDEQEAEDLDDFVKDSLDDINPQYSEESWLRFYEFMEGRFRAKVYLYTSRILEVAAMVLMIWSLLPIINNNIQYESVDNRNYAIENSQDKPNNIEETEADNEQDYSLNGKDKKVISNYQEHNSHSDSELKNKLNAQNIASKNNKSSSDSQVAEVVKQDIAQSTHDNVNNTLENSGTLPVLDNDILLSTGNNPNETSPSIKAERDVQVNKNEHKLQSYKSYAIIEGMPQSFYHDLFQESFLLKKKADLRRSTTIKLDPLTMNNLSPRREPVLAIASVKKADKAYSELAIYSKSRFNLITTPYDPVYDVNSSKSIQYGQGFGISYHQQVHDLISLGIGLEYDKYHYSPPVIQETYGNLDIGYNKISLNKIEFSEIGIPFEFRTNFLHINRWKLHAMVGFNVHAIINAAYSVENSQLGEDIIALTDENPEETHQLAFENSSLSKKAFANGIFGGDWESSFYTSVNAGIGLEYILSPNYGLFMNAEYKHFLGYDGVGPNNDILNAVNILTGFKIAI